MTAVPVFLLRAVTPACDDALLIGICAEMERLDAMVQPWEAEMGRLPVHSRRYIELQSMIDPCLRRWQALRDVVAVTPAHTLDGIKAKARVAVGYYNGDEDDPHDRLVARLVQELAGIAA